MILSLESLTIETPVWLTTDGDVPTEPQYLLMEDSTTETESFILLEDGTYIQLQ